MVVVVTVAGRACVLCGIWFVVSLLVLVVAVAVVVAVVCGCSCACGCV